MVEAATGIPLLSGKFDREKGYSVSRRDNITLILYRVDRLGELAKYIKADVESHFELRPERINLDANYLAACKSFKLLRKTLRAVYSTPLFSYFYSPDEAAGLIEKYAAD